MSKSGRAWVMLVVFGGLPVVLPVLAYVLLPSDRNAPDELAKSVAKFSSWFLTSFLFVGLPGAFGGLLYSMRERKVALPRIVVNDEFAFDPGFLSDIWFGVAGAYVVFLLLPEPLNMATGDPASSDLPWKFIKLFGIAIGAGYGGRVLVDRTLESLKGEMKKVVAEQRKVAEQVAATDEQREKGAKAIQFVSAHLDSGSAPSTATVQDFVNVLTGVSPATFQQVFFKAREVRDSCWKSKNLAQMAKTIPVFEAMIQLDPDKKFHRSHAQLAYALKDSDPPDLVGAKAQLDKAIMIRDQNKEAGFRIYEFVRAICTIRSDPAFQQRLRSSDEIRSLVLKDLRAASEDPYVKTLTKVEDAGRFVPDWAQFNGVNLDQLPT